MVNDLMRGHYKNDTKYMKSGCFSDMQSFKIITGSVTDNMIV
jgi:hypothetical protein